MTKPRVLLFTGDGKGKTTAALGMAMRASGHGMKVCIIQFIKADASVGELAAAAALPGVTIIQTGKGFVPKGAGTDRAKHKDAACDGLQQAAQAMSSGRYDMIVLDEICVAVSKGLLDEDAVEGLVRAAGETKVSCLVLTGRGATARLIALADTVTEMVCVKHGHQRGIKAQKGVEL